MHLSREARQNVWVEESPEKKELDRYIALMMPLVRNAFLATEQGALATVLAANAQAVPEIEFRFSQCSVEEGGADVADAHIPVFSSIGMHEADKLIDILDKSATSGGLDAFDPVWVTTETMMYDVNAHKKDKKKQVVRCCTAPQLEGGITFAELYKDMQQHAPLSGSWRPAYPLNRSAESMGFLMKALHHREQVRLSGYTEMLQQQLTIPPWPDLDVLGQHRFLTANVNVELPMMRLPPGAVAYPLEQVRYRQRRVWRKYLYTPDDPTGVRGAPGWEIALTHVQRGTDHTDLDIRMGEGHDARWELEVEVLQPQEMKDLFEDPEGCIRETARFLAWVTIQFRQCCVL